MKRHWSKGNMSAEFVSILGERSQVVEKGVIHIML